MNKTTLIIPMLVLLAAVSLAGEVTMPSLDTPYDQWTQLATHNSYCNKDTFYTPIGQNQPDSISKQLDYGVRLLNPDIWLVRQQQRSGPLKIWDWEAYHGNDADVNDDKKNDIRFAIDEKTFKGTYPQVVVAHGLDYPVGANAIHDRNRPWQSLKEFLDQVGNWANASANKDQVVTIIFETKISGTLKAPSGKSLEEHYIIPAINSSRIKDRIFYINKANLKVPAPDGSAGGWNVARHGYPTLRQLTTAKKNVVLFPPYLPDRNQDSNWEYEAMTVFGNACLPPNDNDGTWIDARGESAPLNDFTRLLSSIVHAPNLPGTWDKDNRIGLFRQKWEAFRDRYNRLPTAVWVDYYDRGENLLISQQPAGPALFVNELNGHWNSVPKPVANEPVFVPTPNAEGWNNSDVQVKLSASGNVVQAIIWRAYGAANTGLAEAPPPYEAPPVISAEGTTTIRYHAVGRYGKRSDTKFRQIRIDKTPPTITGSLDRPPDEGNVYTSSVTAHFEATDDRSGIAFVTGDIVMSTIGADQSVTGTAVDRAGNQSTFTISNINIGEAKPDITSALEAFAPAGKPFKYQITAMHKPTSFGASGLPEGLSVNTKTGAITGIVELPGGVSDQTFNVEITAASNAGADTETLVLLVSRPSLLTVYISGNGGGTVLGIGKPLDAFSRTEEREVGRMITLVAKADARSFFGGWSGDLDASSPTLKFIMKPDFDLDATFVPNIYITLGKAGNYSGFLAATSATHASMGMISLKVGSRGAYTGKLMLGGNAFVLRGVLAPDGSGATTILRKGLSPLEIVLDLATPLGMDLIKASVSDGSFTAQGIARRVLTDAGALAGRYTVSMEANPNSLLGAGSGALTVSTKGAVKLTGSLGDATLLSGGWALTEGGIWPFYAALYRGGGSIGGSVAFADLLRSDLSCDLKWFKPSLESHEFHPEGWPDGIVILLGGSRYTQPPVYPSLHPVTPAGNAEFSAYQSIHIVPFTQRLNLTPAGKVTLVAPVMEEFTFTFTPATGLYSGQFLDPNGGSVHSFRGAVLQKYETTAMGTFKGDEKRTGRAELNLVP